MFKKIFLGILFLGISLSAQQTPSNLRVKVDANNYLLATGVAGQTNPITTTVFTNARLKTDANGYLLVSIVGGTTAQDKFCLDATNKDLYLARVSANTLGFYTGATACASGTLQAIINSSGLGIGTGTPTSTIPFFIQESNAHTQIQYENTRVTAGDYIDYIIKSGTTSSGMGASNQNYGAGPLGSNRSWLEANAISGAGWDFAVNASNGNFRFYTGGETASNQRLGLDSAGLTLLNLPPQITAGTSDTTTITGDVTQLRYQATITPASGGAGNCATQAAGFKAAALTADCVIATLPAGVKIVAAYADITAGFTCSSTCSGTKVFTLGISAGGTEVFASALSVTATTQFGLADANMGSGMTRAAMIQGGYLPSWASTTTLTARFTSGTGNWGDGSATFVNAGSIKFTLVTELEK